MKGKQGHASEYNLCGGIQRIKSLSSSEISPFIFPAHVSVTLHTALQLRLSAPSVCPQPSVSKKTIYACRRPRGWTTHEPFKMRRNKMCIYRRHLLVAEKPVLLRRYQSTRRHNRGNALILSKYSLTESFMFFFFFPEVLCCLDLLFDAISSSHLDRDALTNLFVLDSQRWRGLPLSLFHI